MYSLYRAWLSLGPPPLQTELCSTSGYASHSNGSPDVTLQVGPSMTQFSAHKSILSAHSGFFKAIFTNHTGANPIPVPSINVDEFSSLLTFMYTGYLDLNFGNIYNVLLATHILHMPHALEISRNFLIHNNPCSPSVVKPIPSRKSVLPHPQIYPPLYGTLPKSEVTPFREIAREHTVTSGSVEERTPELEPKRPPKTKRSDLPNTDKVVLDIACCDGPVRFHRVLNKNYGLKDVDNTAYDLVETIDRNLILNKVMNENIRDKQNENSSGELFACVYCNHTFKSQYCYQKHARRHLNPVSLEVKTIQKVENIVSNKREVKLLDMNVQYYPCKTCGSKFPSYYFVHKHRKMCHADELAEGNDSNETKGESEEAKTSEGSEIEVGNNT